MSKEELQKYLPDSAKEFSFFGTALVSLSSALSGIFIVAEHPIWSLFTIGLSWLGHTVEKYFQLHETEKKEKPQ
jgi:hypothetical protein